jgi:transcriptional regulator with PAS, ATPase and Fis domain
VLLITSPGQIAEHQIPIEIITCAEIVEVSSGDDSLANLIQKIQSGMVPASSSVRAPETARNVAREATVSSSVSASISAVGGSRLKLAAELTPTIRRGDNFPTSDTAPRGSEATKAHNEQNSSPASGDQSGSADGNNGANAPLSIADHFRTRTPELRQMLRRLDVAARHNVTILLIGETGSGKTHLASLIHEMSPRSSQPFLHVACGALPGELIESELFGHVKGSFTSAHADKDGKFLVAGTGTILLDEIDVLTPDQQVKLLRVIEKGEFEPVGSNRTLHVKARIIAASNLQLQPLVEQGRFRPDLYYRLNTLSFTIPPLRKRLPDIEPLARYFVHHHAAQLGIDVIEVVPEFIQALQMYPWPGNVRELENAVRSAVIYSTDGKLIPDALPQHILEGSCGPANDPSVAGFFAAKNGESLGNRMELTEKDMIEQALLNHNFSRTNTARHLGISRVTLYNKMRKYGIMSDR